MIRACWEWSTNNSSADDGFEYEHRHHDENWYSWKNVCRDGFKAERLGNDT